MVVLCDLLVSEDEENHFCFHFLALQILFDATVMRQTRDRRPSNTREKKTMNEKKRERANYG